MRFAPGVRRRILRGGLARSRLEWGMTRKHHRAPSTASGYRFSFFSAPVIAMIAVLFVAGAIIVLLPRDVLPREIDVGRAHRMYEQGALFLDVRSLSEWEQGHIAGSLLIPLDDLPDRIDELPTDRDIVVVCRSGRRSREGAQTLRDAGFDRVTCMQGGIEAWFSAGYPVE